MYKLRTIGFRLLFWLAKTMVAPALTETQKRELESIYTSFHLIKDDI